MNKKTDQGPDAKKIYPDHGAVAYCLHESAGATAEYSTSRLVEAIEEGLAVEELEVLRAGLDLPMEKLVSRLGISKATLHRRKRAGRLGPEESDRVLRFARLMGKAVEVFETKENARQWLASPQAGLGGAVPLDYAETEIGAREVEDLLGRIEYGVYS
jgi:putative toxin-antitoxin system antitoxin component (TIGR02293 family)